jgi:tRNA (guanine37-N1)-methyltransferase
MNMVTLDRSAFSEVIRLVALRIRAQQCSTFMKRLDGHILSRPKVRPIIPDEAEGGCAQTRLLLLAETVLDTELRGLPEELRAFVLGEGAVPLAHERTVGYDLLTVEQVLRRLLPQGMEVPSAFEQVGHVAHVNLRDEQLPYKAVIGQVLLDKNSRLRSVVNKVESISNELRVFPMELLAGEPSLVTKVRENGATFELDYREVYWNSRLEREHWRVVEQIGEDEVVCDMMAGIGPFAMPAALRGSKVYANDLNPHSAHWLRRNVAVNKVPRNVQCYNLCGRAFVRLLLAAPNADADAAPVADADAPTLRPSGL